MMRTVAGVRVWVPRLKLLRLFALLIDVAIAAVLKAQTSQPVCGPDWSWPSPAAIEWAALAGRGAAVTLIVATHDARLHLVDPVSGKQRLAEPIKTAPGVRLVPVDAPDGTNHAVGRDDPGAVGIGPADVAYCFDRHAAYAIRLADPPGLKWQYGASLGEGEEFPGEPDNLTGWTLAQVTTAGMLLGNSDGSVVLLSHADGRARWQISLGRLPVARLHVRGDTAVVLWKLAGEVKAAFLSSGEEQAEPRISNLGELWPLWSTLLNGGLLTVSPMEVVLWPKEGMARRLDVRPLSPASAVVDVFEPPSRVAKDGAGAIVPGTLLLTGDGPQPAAYDLATGKKLWPTDEHMAAGLNIYTLVVCGDRLVTTNKRGTVVYDAPTGEVLGYCQKRFPAQCVAWRLAGQFLYTLYREPNAAETPLRLVRVELGKAAARESSTTRPSSAAFDLRPVNEVRQVVWTDCRIVLAGPNGLRAYMLP